MPLLAWTMLNPSTADHAVNDRTIVRCIDFARRWGYGAILVVNLFAWRATSPAALRLAEQPVGPANDTHLLAAARHDVIAAWGSSVPPRWHDRPRVVRELLERNGARLHHLGLTRAGQPRHPLYLRATTTPTRWAA